MAYTTTGINTSATIVGAAAAEIKNVAGKAVKFTGGKVAVATTAGEVVMGIAVLTSADVIAAGEDVDIQIKEIGKAVAGAEIAVGAELATNATGALVTATAGQFVVATALEAATAAGQIINVQLTKYQKNA